MLDFPSGVADNAKNGNGFIYRSAEARWRRSPGWTLVERGVKQVNIASLAIALRPSYRQFRLNIRGLRPVADNSNNAVYWRASYDNGSTFVSGASSYDYSGVYTHRSTGPLGFGAVNSHAQVTAGFPNPGNYSNIEADIHPGGVSECPLVQVRVGHVFLSDDPIALRVSGYCGNTGRITHIQFYGWNGTAVINLNVRSWELLGLL